MRYENSSNLETTVKTLLQERSLSMRQLASITGINVATISKTLAGKQRPNPEHLQTIAHHLSVPPAVLFKAAGFNVELPATEDLSTWRTNIEQIVQHVGFNLTEINKQSITQELLKYEGYARTGEGHQVIVEKFPDKREQISGSGPFADDLDRMFQRYMQHDISEQERVILGSGLLYFVSATDSIPDFMFPIGYLDDALAIQIIWERLSSLSSL